jgi:uncharacterized lipoprotein YmbA
MTHRPAVLRRFAGTALLALLAFGCAGAPPPGYYTIGAIPPSSPAASVTPPAVISVGPVDLPDYLDRRPIVTRDNAFAVRLAGNDYWAAPLQEMVPRVLVSDLAMRLPADRIEGFPQISDSVGDYRIVIDVSRFDVDMTGMATLVARWRLYGRNTPQPLLVADETLKRQTETTGYEAGAAALSATLGDLADRVAEAVATVRARAPRAIGAG